MKLAILDDYQRLALKSADWERLRRRGSAILRGPIVDEGAMLEALKSGRLAHAALDVYDREPLPADHPLRKMENVTLVPHLGYVSEEVYASFWSDCVENVEAWLEGKPIRVVNPEALG